MKALLKTTSLYTCAAVAVIGIAMFAISLCFFIYGYTNSEEGTIEVSSVTLGIGLSAFILTSVSYAVIKACWIYIEKNGIYV